MKKGLVVAVVAFAVVYVATWFVLGDRAMLEDNAERLWTDWDVKTYAASAPLYLCTNLPSPESLTVQGRTVEVMSTTECRNPHVLDSLQRQADTVRPDSASGIVLGFAEAALHTPPLTRNGVGLWFYGTDFAETCDEYATWALYRWIVLFEASGDGCGLSPHRDV